jgi:hypothetical protein
VRPLDKLRALTRREPPATGVLSLNSFISSPAPNNFQEQPRRFFTKETKERETDLTLRAQRPYEKNELNEKTLRAQRREEQAAIDLVKELWPGATVIRVTEKEDRRRGPSDASDERAALVAAGAGVSRTWAEGFAALWAMPPPPGVMPARWRRVIDAAGMFLDRWAAVAVARGWTDLDVFGCDPDRPDARYDCMGLVLLLDRCEVVAIDEHGADLMTNSGARQRFRRRPLPAGTISLWELASR